MNSFLGPFKERSLDLGQRVRFLTPVILRDYASQEGLLTTDSAQLLATKGFFCDVSTSENDGSLGLDWFKFLADYRFTLTRESGAFQHEPI